MRRYARGFQSIFSNELLGLPANYRSTQNGSYVIITSNTYLDEVEPLAEWKRLKGFNTVVVSTSTTGSLNTAIYDWLENAYTTWPVPPEYVLLFGDINTIPTWGFHSTPTDLPYALLDGDDYLPDVFLGRLSVESEEEAETVVAKTMAYERDPYLTDTGWFTRSLMVGSDYGSNTPVTTITWCGQQLESIGFDPAEMVFYPPYWTDYLGLIPGAINTGVSFIAYRGWAYGAQGWEPPYFTSDEVFDLTNGWMLPIVFSYTCSNGDFTYGEPCFGEAWIRAGSSLDPKGAVAFLGAAEVWAHTRYNDALAISTFERVTDPSITDLGQLILAAKIRFMDYFPHELTYDESGEESVEYYHHTYNLLGDPELNYWTDTPGGLVVNHSSTIYAGSNFVTLTVREADGVTPVEGARVGIVQGTQLLGCDESDASGLVHLSLETIEAGDDLAVTVTHTNRVPYEGSISVNDSQAYLALASFIMDDTTTGNGDGSPNPNETFDLLVTILNGGTLPASGVTGTLTSLGPAIVDVGTTGFPDIPAGGTVVADQPFRVTLDPDVENGREILFRLQVEHDVFYIDVSELAIIAAAPVFLPDTAYAAGDGYADPGETVAFYVQLSNDGMIWTSGITATLFLDTPGYGEVTDSEGSFGSIPPGGSNDNSGDPFEIRINEDTAVGVALSFRMALTTDEGYESEVSFGLFVGEVTTAAPTGPDAYGYYAYDSGDGNYPDETPTYDWTEISPLQGGTGQLLMLAPEYNTLQSVAVALPFSFQFYGVVYDSARVFRDGHISFDTTDFYDFYNWTIPSEHGNHSIVAPFWDMFKYHDGDSNQDGIYHKYDAGSGTYTIEWSHMRHNHEEIPGYDTFQLILLDPSTYPTATGDGEILFQYNQISNNDYLRNYATVGIEDPTEFIGLEYTYGNIYAPGAAPLTDGLAVKLTTDPPAYEATSVFDEFDPSAQPVRLLGHIPNPAGPGARILFDLPRMMPVTLSIYDPQGRCVRTLLTNPSAPAGRHTIVWDGRDKNGRPAVSGIYLYKLSAGDKIASKKMVFME